MLNPLSRARKGRNKPGGPPAKAASSDDVFPAIRRENGHVVDERRPAVDAPGMVVTGVRVLTPGDRLQRQGRITLAQGEAAREWYALNLEITGGKSPRWIGDRSGGGGGAGVPLTERQAAAFEKLRRAEAVLGPHGRRFLTEVLVREVPLVAALADMQRRQGLEPVARSVADQRAVGTLQALLEILVWRWRIVPRYGRRPAGPAASSPPRW